VRTDDNPGRRDFLAGKSQESHGVAKEDTEKPIGEWQR